MAAEVSLPRELLKGGLRLVDSPGVGSLDSTKGARDAFHLSSAVTVLLVRTPPRGTPHRRYNYSNMRCVSAVMAAVLAKADLYPQWRVIGDLDQGHLKQIGDLPIFAVSSDLRLLAASQQDRELNDESGFPALVAHLRRDADRACQALLSARESVRAT